MSKNLVIVESPAKAKTIEKFLGKDYIVKSSFGHVRDLEKTGFGIDIEKNFEPHYVITDDKKKIVKELKALSEKAETVWMASDEDREGEAIAWHLAEALNLKESKIKRIAFHEITKEAIQKAITNPRDININLVNAQQARRVLDRLVGFELSPLLWKKVKPSLSAGRVQSVAVRLIVEREKEIENFKTSHSYKVIGSFLVTKNGKSQILNAELGKRFDTIEEAEAFLKKCIGAQFKISDIETKPAKKSPAPPFTTSTLQQEASRKLGFSVGKTMLIAQQLYESGLITYMRTDSLNLSEMAIATAKNEIISSYGKAYAQTRKYTTKTKGAQEAHEAIRPTYISNHTIQGDSSQQRLYEMIWKRTIASQMSDALLEKTNINISVSTTKEEFIARGEVIKFDGFLKVYIESTDDENDENQKGLLPPVSKGEVLNMEEINAIQRFTQHPPRYTEASLVKKMEELGIGRPSTYAPIISTIQKRGYVVIETKPGSERTYNTISLKNDKITNQSKKEVFGNEKNKLFPTDIGNLVNEFLTDNFDDIMDYNFTASVEKEFDDIALGNKVWYNMVSAFYHPFKKKLQSVEKTAKRVSGEKFLGTEPASGENVYVKLGRYGPMIQVGEADNEAKPRFASLQKGQSMDSITLSEALELFKLPRTIGIYENEEIKANIGRFGPYLIHKKAFYSIPKDDDPMSISLERSIEIIKLKIEKDANKIIKEFDSNPDMKILNGRWGPYIAIGKENFKIPKNKDPKELSLEDCLTIVNSDKKSKPRKAAPKKTKESKVSTKKKTSKK